MNLSNKLTSLRLVLTPLFLIFLLVEALPLRFCFAFLLFLFLAFTDYLDGKLAREKNMVTNFGKIMDPLADKILISTILICFVQMGCVSAAPVAVIIIREFFVTAVRYLVMQESNEVVSSGILGKIKMVCQTFTIIFILFAYLFEAQGLTYFNFVDNILMWATCAMSVASGAVYFYENRISLRRTLK